MSKEYDDELYRISSGENAKIFLQISKFMNMDVYHYTSTEGIKGIFESKSLHMSKSDFLNDFMEQIYLKKIVNEFCEKNRSNYDEVFIDYLRFYFRYLTETDYEEGKSGIYLERSNSFILSLSKECDSQLLWSGYGNYEGYSVGFDLDKLIRMIATQAVDLGRQGSTVHFDYGNVIYDYDQQNTIIKNVFEKIYSVWQNHGGRYEDIKSAIISFFSAIIYCSNFFKDRLFQGEREYRIVIHIFEDENKINKILNFKNRNGVIIPYIKFPFEFNEDKCPLTSILIGPKNNLDIAEKGLKQFLKSNFLSSICKEVKRSKITLRY